MKKAYLVYQLFKQVLRKYITQWQIQYANTNEWVDIQSNPDTGPLAGHSIYGEDGDSLLILPLTGLNGSKVRAMAWSDSCNSSVFPIMRK